MARGVGRGRPRRGDLPQGRRARPRPSQARAALRAKLGRGCHLLPTGRAGGAQPGPTLFAKLRLRAMLMLAVWTLHQAVLLSAAPAPAALDRDGAMVIVTPAATGHPTVPSPPAGRRCQTLR